MKKLLMLFSICLTLLFVSTAMAADVTVAWDDPSVDGYRIYAAEIGSPMDYTSPVAEVASDVHQVTFQLDETKVWWLVARAFKGTLESPDSKIVVYDRSGGTVDTQLNAPIILP